MTKAASGRLAFTYALESFLYGADTYGQDELRRTYVVKDRHRLWGLDPDAVPSLHGRYGWRVLDHPAYEGLAQRYAVSPSRSLASIPIERMVYAEKV